MQDIEVINEHQNSKLSCIGTACTSGSSNGEPVSETSANTGDGHKGENLISTPAWDLEAILNIGNPTMLQYREEWLNLYQSDSESGSGSD